MAGRKARAKPARKERYKKQFEITVKHKIRKLSKHILRHPNDLVAKNAK